MMNERLAAVYLDLTAMHLLHRLDRETSILWAKLPEVSGHTWPECARALTTLALAGYVESSPRRIRLSAEGDRFVCSDESIYLAF